MKRVIITIFAFTNFVFLSLKVSTPADTSIEVLYCLDYFRKGADTFVHSNQELYTAIDELSVDRSTVIHAKQALEKCRLDYKKIEFFTSYFFASETRFYNAAPKFEVEEPTLELVEPMGLQQIETLLFDDDVMANKGALIAQSEALLSSAKDMNALLFSIEIKNAQILESLRIELIRMSVLSISGYDAPFLKSGIIETRTATEALQEILKPYIQSNAREGKLLESLILNSIKYLKENQDFDTFNRMDYLTRFALPMQKELGLFINKLGFEINTTEFLNYKAPHIFSKDALVSWDNDTLEPAQEKALAELGRQLFFDKSLSGNSSTSCSSCHQPQNYFTDLLEKSPSLVADSILKRNTPTLLYAGWQHTQFWDGRVVNLKDQIHNVVFNPLEMNGSKESLYKQVLQKDKYKKLIRTSFPGKRTEDPGIAEVSAALAVFIKQLSPMDSPFDRYINGEHAALTNRQVMGFNLFMGKAQCGTCHFPPFFNSLLPPFYELSEVEILGTTKTDDFNHAELDTDLGRFDLYKMRYYKRAFKTPTVRNATKTAPYMHNGTFKSLAKVVEFYNKGGGKGLALNVEDQTLSAKPLNLSDYESENIILFLESLTDSNPNLLINQK